MCFLASNVIALTLLYQRFANMGYVPDFTTLMYQHMGPLLAWTPSSPPCGFMNSSSFVLHSKRVLLSDGLHEATVVIRNGRIAEVATGRVTRRGLPALELEEAVVSPGLIDLHVHLNEPGREDWEGMETGTRAALAGGITTIIEMPLNSHPCTTTPERVTEKLEIAKAKSLTNIGFWGGVVPGNAANATLLAAILDAGALGFKSFTCPSGINDFPHVTPDDVSAALPTLLARGAPYLVHAELVHDVPQTEASGRQYSTYLATRPPSFERQAVRMLVDRLATAANATGKRVPGFKLHIVHVSDADVLAITQVARKTLPISTETCPHYLTWAAEHVPEGATQFKCAPPLRAAANRDALRAALRRGHIDTLGSDHSPAPPHMKETQSGDFLKAWGGISGLQYLLPAAATAARAARLDLTMLPRLLSEGPAKVANLQHRKGRIVVGMDADLVVWSPESPADTSVEANLHRHKVSPYTDTQLWGEVLMTIVNGHLVYTKERGVYPQPCSRVLTFKDTKYGRRKAPPLPQAQPQVDQTEL